MKEKRAAMANAAILMVLTFRLVLVEISGIEPLLFVCLKDSQGKEKT